MTLNYAEELDHIYEEARVRAGNMIAGVHTTIGQKIASYQDPTVVKAYIGLLEAVSRTCERKDSGLVQKLNDATALFASVSTTHAVASSAPQASPQVQPAQKEYISRKEAIALWKAEDKKAGRPVPKDSAYISRFHRCAKRNEFDVERIGKRIKKVELYSLQKVIPNYGYMKAKEHQGLTHIDPATLKSGRNDHPQQPPADIVPANQLYPLYAGILQKAGHDLNEVSSNGHRERIRRIIKNHHVPTRKENDTTYFARKEFEEGVRAFCGKNDGKNDIPSKVPGTTNAGQTPSRKERNERFARLKEHRAQGTPLEKVFEIEGISNKQEQHIYEMLLARYTKSKSK